MATATIDTARSMNGRLVQELTKTKVDYSLAETITTGKTYTLDEAFEPLWERLNKHYGTDLRKL